MSDAKVERPRGLRLYPKIATEGEVVPFLPDLREGLTAAGKQADPDLA